MLGNPIDIPSSILIWFSHYVLKEVAQFSLYLFLGLQCFSIPIPDHEDLIMDTMLNGQYVEEVSVPFPLPLATSPWISISKGFLLGFVFPPTWILFGLLLL